MMTSRNKLDRRRRRRVVTSNSEPSDAALMAAVSEQRDTKAFERLYLRYQTAAYNLANRITGQREAAEEVLQESCLRVWQKASDFRPDGSFGGWFLKIVAGESLDTLKRSSRHRRRVKIATEIQPEKESESSTSVCENEELRKLRALLAALPQPDQQVLALYYGGGMSQDEIALKLKMPQRTVSYRIKKILDTLRGNLTQAGLASATLILNDTLLAEAMCSGETVPSGLSSSVLDSVFRSKTTSTFPAGITSQTLVITGALILAAGGWWWLEGSGRNQDTSAPPARTPSASNQTDTPSGNIPFNKRKPTYHLWKFDSLGQPPEFELLQGSWLNRGRRGSEGTGTMIIQPGGFMARINIPEITLPVRVNIRMVILTHKERAECGLGWYHYERPPALIRNIGSIKRYRLGEAIKIIYYVTETFIISTSKLKSEPEDIRTIFVGTHATGTKLTLFSSQSWMIDNLLIETVATHSVPDVTPFLNALKAIPSQKRTGKVLLPQFKTQRPGHPVLVEFTKPN